jgi:hypothetical protein
LILLNAPGNDLRLGLTVISGFGDPAPDRSISIALNGVKFDEIKTAGLANIVTKPFQARGFLNRLSLSLSDSALPLPYRWGLFRRWVPKDGRRINIVVSRVDLLTDREYENVRMPCRLDLSRPESWNMPNLNGIYADKWIATEAQVSLQACGEADSISVQGFAPSLPAFQPVVPVTVTIDGAGRTVELDRPGPFTIAVPLPRTFEKGSRHDISIRSPRVFVPAELGLGPDRRRLSIMLNIVEIGKGRPYGVTADKAYR